MNIHCKQCGVAFQPQRSTAVYCSSNCRKAASRKQPTKSSKTPTKQSEAPIEDLESAFFRSGVSDWLVKQCKRSKTVEIIPTTKAEMLCLFHLVRWKQSRLPYAENGFNYDICHIYPGKKVKGRIGTLHPNNLFVAPASNNRAAQAAIPVKGHGVSIAAGYLKMPYRIDSHTSDSSIRAKIRTYLAEQGIWEEFLRESGVERGKKEITYKSLKAKIPNLENLPFFRLLEIASKLHNKEVMVQIREHFGEPYIENEEYDMNHLEEEITRYNKATGKRLESSEHREALPVYPEKKVAEVYLRELVRFAQLYPSGSKQQQYAQSLVKEGYALCRGGYNYLLAYPPYHTQLVTMDADQENLLFSLVDAANPHKQNSIVPKAFVHANKKLPAGTAESIWHDLFSRVMQWQLDCFTFLQFGSVPDTPAGTV